MGSTNGAFPQMTTTATQLPESTDVLIVGAGPVGLLIAYQLSKFGCHNYTIIGKPFPAAIIPASVPTVSK